MRLEAVSREKSADTLRAKESRPGEPYFGCALGGTSPFRSNAVAEVNTGPDERDEICAVDSPPTALCHREELEGHERALTNDDSDDGTDPDPDGDGDPNEAGENDPTPIDELAVPALSSIGLLATLIVCTACRRSLSRR